MNARDLHDATIDLLEKGVDRLCYGTDERQIVLRALDLLARVQESDDELVRELRECETIVGNLCAEGRCPKMSVPVRDEDEDMRLTRTMQKAAAALVAQQRYIDDMHDTLDKIAAAIGVQGRDADKLLSTIVSLKAHAEAMAKDLEDWIGHGRYNDCSIAESQAILDAYRAANPKDTP